MSGEYIYAESIDLYWQQLKSLYVRRSLEWKDLSEDEYNSIERSEREDSDNHYNLERLESEETKVIDICHYKYMPERYVAYKIEVRQKDGSNKFFYFKIKLKEDIE